MRTPFRMLTLAIAAAALAACQSAPTGSSGKADGAACEDCRGGSTAALDECKDGLPWPAGLPRSGGNRHYVSNRAPLVPSALIKLPIGSIAPKGWIHEQLRLEAGGFIGRLPELSTFCRADSGWLQDTTRHGWEELPYWLKGFGDLGYILQDARIMAEAEKWIEAALRTQQPDGYFGPAMNKNRHDAWPNMVMLFCLQSRYEWKPDPRILDLMTKYFRYQLNQPPEHVLPESWQRIRGGDNLQSIYWLYNRTGDAWLLDAATKIHESTDDWTHTVPNWWHGVNICQGFREPGDYWLQSHQRIHLEAPERNYTAVRREFGRQPGGMFGADENSRVGKTDPIYAAETCSMVEMMYSCESLLRNTGNPVWADRCEDVAFNSLPASMTSDEKALHYLTAPNLVLCDKGGAHEFQNQGEMVGFNPWSYRCCQHNVAQGWPYYAEHLWMATQGDGLSAVLYAPCVVRAKVGEAGTEVGIVEKTDYPFGETVDLTVATTKPVTFPLVLRIPGWCRGATVAVAGQAAGVDAKAGTYVTLDREWKNGDTVRLTLPMELKVREWPRMKNAVSVDRGPLSYSLRIEERWQRYGGTDEWPATELEPASAWNYGLVVDPKHPEATLTVVKREGAPAAQPFAFDAAPIAIKAKGRKIPGWKLVNSTCGELRVSPIRTEEPEEEITLVPMGSARLRISMFPTVGEGPDAREWGSGGNFMHTWMVVGPFPNAENQGFAKAFPPEQEMAQGKVDLGAAYPGVRGEAKWKKHTSIGDLVNLVGLFDPNEDVAAYAYAIVESPKARKIQVLVGSDDGVIVWVNGKKAHENNVQRGAETDQDSFTVDMQKGLNTILVKVCQGKGGWGFYFRFAEKRGDRLAYPDPGQQ